MYLWGFPWELCIFLPSSVGKVPGAGKVLSWRCDLFAIPCFLSWRLSVLSRLCHYAIRRRGKQNLEHLLFAGRKRAADASPAADVSAWVRLLTQNQALWLPSSPSASPGCVCDYKYHSEASRQKRSCVFWEDCCLPELPAGSCMWFARFFSFVLLLGRNRAGGCCRTASRLCWSCLLCLNQLRCISLAFWHWVSKSVGQPLHRPYGSAGMEGKAAAPVPLLCHPHGHK